MPHDNCFVGAKLCKPSLLRGFIAQRGIKSVSEAMRGLTCAKPSWHNHDANQDTTVITQKLLTHSNNGEFSPEQIRSGILLLLNACF